MLKFSEVVDSAACELMVSVASKGSVGLLVEALMPWWTAVTITDQAVWGEQGGLDACLLHIDAVSMLRMRI